MSKDFSQPRSPLVYTQEEIEAPVNQWLESWRTMTPEQRKAEVDAFVLVSDGKPKPFVTDEQLAEFLRSESR